MRRLKERAGNEGKREKEDEERKRDQDEKNE